jgi:hypothetical protein
MATAIGLEQLRELVAAGAELVEKALTNADVTTPEGRLIGVARREDLEQAGAG